MIDFSKVFFSIFWANRKLPLCWVRVSYSLPFIRNFRSIFHHIPNCEHSSFTLHHIPKLIRLATFFTLHSSPHTQAHSLGFTLHSSFFILHSSLFTLKNYPTLPSKLISKSFWASTANSIGSLLSTSFPKPFTMSEIAFSVSIPR